MFDIISIGDTTLDTFLLLDHNEVKIMCTLDKEKCELCLKYADKIPVEQLHDSVAGNAANAAVATSRLGLKTALWTIMGEDVTGKRAHDGLSKEGIDLRYFEFQQGHRSNASTVISIDGERTILIYHEPKTYILPDFEQSKWVYLTSMSQGSEMIFENLVDHVQKSGAKLAYQPGTFQLRLGSERSKAILSHCEIFFVNKQEAIEYTKFPDHDLKALFQAVHHLGPKIAVITDGTSGAYASNGQKAWFLGIIPEIPRIEATGAGDAFASAFTAAIVQDMGIPEAMRWGLFNASGVIQKIGPQAGVLKKDEMLAWSQKYSSYQPKEI